MAEIRQTLFLYPNLSNLVNEKQDDILRLITRLKIIVNNSNDKIERILRSSSFAYVRCMPSVNIEEMSSDTFADKEAERVRVCVIGYNDESYESSYRNICTQYKENKLNISHLVGVKINKNVASVKFYRPEQSPFDVIVEMKLCDLEDILVSIMLDISIYHYFSLSNEIEYRRKFSAIKMNIIKESEHINDYGDIDNIDNIDYLPFSYPYVKEISINKAENTFKFISNALSDYFKFIKKYVCTTIDFNKHKELNNPYCYKEKGMSDEQIDTISEFVSKSSDINNECFVILKDDEKPIIINDENDAQMEWLSTFSTPLNDYNLYYIKIGA